MWSRWWVLGLLVVHTACGRIHFDEDGELRGVNYGRSWRVYPRGIEVPPIVPLVWGSATFDAMSDLPAGLSLDPQTGTIAGTPTSLRSIEVVIRASNATTVIDTPLLLEVVDATTITETADLPDMTTSDGACLTAAGTCSLRAAIEQANADGMAVAPFVPAGTYRIESMLGAGVPIALVGFERDRTVLDLSTNGHLQLLDESVVSDLTMTGSTVGALKLYAGDFKVSNVTFSGNVTTGTAAAIYGDTANTDLEYLVVRDNSAFTGPGILLYNGTHEVRYSSFENNTGAKFDNYTGALSLGADAVGTVRGCYFGGNRSVGPGAALSTEYGAAVRIESSTFYDNASSDWDAGAITLSLHAPGPAELVNNTFIANRGNGGFLGVIRFEGTNTLANNVFAGNIDTSTPGACRSYAFQSTGGNVRDVDGDACASMYRTDDRVADPALASVEPLAVSASIVTIPPPRRSPLFGAGVVSECPPSDGRGVLRERDRCDAGAHQLP